MIKLPPEKLRELVVGARLIRAEEFDELAEEAGRKQQDVAGLLIAKEITTEDYLYELIAKFLGVERIDLSIGRQKVDEGVLRIINEETARRLRAIVFHREPDGAFDVAMEDPSDLETIDFLERRLQAKIKPFLARDADLQRGFALYERRLAEDFKRIIEESIQKSLQLKSKKGALEEAAAELPIVAIVDNLVSYAISLRASDVHLEMIEDALLVRYRIDGVLHEILKIPKEIQPAILARIKLLSGLRIDEHAKPQDGRFRYKVSGELMDIRVAVMPTFYGEKVELRLLTASQKPFSLSTLGMSPETVAIIQENLKKTYGMILVTGPTSAGKTTTLYSLLNILNKPEINIVTVEDPVEYDVRYVNQTQINPAAGITFANGLRAILRQDPNVIMVGEIRDDETADISVQAALTGHLVLSSIHTNDAVTAIPRLFDMNIAPFLTAAVLNAVVAQRLVRTIHADCMESYEVDSKTEELIRSQLKAAGADYENYKIPKIFYRGRGCPTDNFTGYLGRTAIFEVVNVSEAIRKEIVSPEFSLDNARRIARQEGMISMFEDGLKKTEVGVTSFEEVLRVIRE